MGKRPDLALACVVHALAATAFYRPGSTVMSALDIAGSSAPLGFAEGVADSAAAAAVEARHAAWGTRLPNEVEELFGFVVALDQADQLALFAHVASLSVNALTLRYARRPEAIAHADAIAALLPLDMTKHWQPTAASYFGRVTKSHIVAAVREGVSDEAADGIAGAKKGDMAVAAESLIAGTGWLPVQLRTVNAKAKVEESADDAAPEGDAGVAHDAAAEPFAEAAE
ncbi:MAG: chromosome partitioning protein ParB [Novosphingobium sp.]|nr:chromosome partitioning protein ParB [Novosphingobium sp.]